LDAPVLSASGEEPTLNDLETSTLRHYLGVLWRRRWIVVVPLVVLVGVAFVSSKRQPPVYEASAQVLMNHQDQVATSLVGVQTPVEDPARYAQTQTLVASTPTLARRVLVATGTPRGSVKNLLDHLNVYSNADVLVFSVTDHNPDVAERTAAAYAREYTAFRRELDTRELGRTLSQIEARVAALRAGRSGSKTLYASLLAKEEDIRLLEALRQSNVYVIRTPEAGDANQIAPRPLRTTALAATVGLLIGLVAAFLVDALDTRVRSSDELEERLGVPLLGSLPGPRTNRDGAQGLVALADGGEADAFVALRTRVALANVDLGARSLLVASPGPREGAAIVAANLAAAIARAGRHVVLVDVDLRESSITQLFSLTGQPGLTGVLARETTLDGALVPVELEATGGTRSVAEPGAGSLKVLAAGQAPARPGELAASAAVGSLLGEVAGRADVVVVVAPPLLAFGDAVALGTSVDALLVVSRLASVRRASIRELRRVLATWPAATLGLVVTGVEAQTLGGGGSGRGLSGRGLGRDWSMGSRFHRLRRGGSGPAVESSP
jgi:receptor protein-tyrosine kinase